MPGARVPVVLTSRADTARARMASCAVAALMQMQGASMLQMSPRDRHGYDLIVNAGSSSVKFQIFSVEGEGTLRRLIKGQMDGIGSRPRLRASGADSDPLADRAYPIERFRTFRLRWASQADGCGTNFASARWPSVIASFMAVRTMTGRC